MADGAGGGGGRFTGKPSWTRRGNYLANARWGPTPVWKVRMRAPMILALRRSQLHCRACCHAALQARPEQPARSLYLFASAIEEIGEVDALRPSVPRRCLPQGHSLCYLAIHPPRTPPALFDHTHPSPLCVLLPQQYCRRTYLFWQFGKRCQLSELVYFIILD